MFRLQVTGWSFQADLQLVQADVALDIDDTIVLDEPFCLQVGIGSLLLSAFEPVYPRQFDETGDWRVQPFFVCGCGDSSCRAAVFAVRHLPDGQVEWQELMQSEFGTEWRGDTYVFGLDEYVEALRAYGEAYLAFLRPHAAELGEEIAGSVRVVEGLIGRLTGFPSVG
jgi:hypothetical protein